MYICKDCKSTFQFEDGKKIKKCFETEYGVGSLFDGRNYYEDTVCPNCHSEEIVEATRCQKCDEWFDEEDLDYNEVDELCCKECRGE